MPTGLPPHGGDLAAAEARWGRPAKGWLDLSTGINPWPYPLTKLPIEAWTRLPGRAEELALARAAARHWRTASDDHVLAAPGTSALIQALPRLLPPGPAAVFGPTYAEHGHAMAAAGHQVSEVASLDALAEARLAVVVNPNNPDGHRHPPAALTALAARMAAKGGLLVVDEAFADTDPTLSVAPLLGPGLVVLRSFGKFWGLAGLRLGFALAEPGLIATLRRQFGPWAVSGPALNIGTRALADDGWAEATRAHLAFEAGRLDTVLHRAGLSVVGGTTLFRLVEHHNAARLYDWLGRAGILVRTFAGRPDRLRFGLSGAKDLDRLEAALA